MSLYSAAFIVLLSAASILDEAATNPTHICKCLEIQWQSILFIPHFVVFFFASSGWKETLALESVPVHHYYTCKYLPAGKSSGWSVALGKEALLRLIAGDYNIPPHPTSPQHFLLPTVHQYMSVCGWRNITLEVCHGWCVGQVAVQGAMGNRLLETQLRCELDHIVLGQGTLL